ncbi:MAG: thioesterase family protein [Actinomycetia bacterium]|nr:thioesterase family protein [Actinomycetes bacterium]
MADASRPFPTLEQVLALPSSYSTVIPEEYIDGNGHLNIARYMQLHSDGGWAYFAEFGMSEESARAGGPTTFDVEHHIVYLNEVMAGDEVSVHVRSIDRTEKGIHSLQFLLNRTRGEIANTHEAVALSVDMATRRSAALPAHLVAVLDEQLRKDQALDWAPPLCGVMGLRREPLRRPEP